MIRTGARTIRAFTLVELMVVIGVIVLLVGLTVAVIPAIGTRAERQETEGTLTLLAQAMHEWELASERPLSWGQNGFDQWGNPNFDLQYEVQAIGPHVYSISEVLRVIGRNDTIRTIVGSINPDRVIAYDSQNDPAPVWLSMADEVDPNAAHAVGMYDDGKWDGVLTVLDAWGQPIRAVHPGRVAVPGESLNVNPDGTIYRDFANFDDGEGGVEELYGIAANRITFFVSAGPDRNFGSLSPSASLAQREATSDNLYSYRPLDPAEYQP